MSLDTRSLEYVSTFHLHSIRESKKSGGKKDEKKRKSAGGDKDRERGGGNDSFKSREFIETSEESSSDSDHKSKSKRKKVKPETIGSYPTDCSMIHYQIINVWQL